MKYMKWASLTRKTAGVLLICSDVYSIYVLIFVLWHMAKFDYNIGFNYLDFTDFWAPVISSIISLHVTTFGIIAVFKRKNWWLALIGSIFTLLTPAVWQMFPTITEAYVVIPRVIALLIGIMAIILTIFSRKYFKGVTTEPRTGNSLF